MCDRAKAEYTSITHVLLLRSSYVCGVLCPFSGYYIFSEPLKRAVMEVKAKEARDRAAAGGGSGSTGSGGSSSSSRSGGSSSSDVGGGESSAAAANGR